MRVPNTTGVQRLSRVTLVCLLLLHRLPVFQIRRR